MSLFSNPTIVNPLLSSADNSSWINNPTGMEGLPVPIAPVRPNNGTSTSTPTSTTTTLDSPFLAGVNKVLSYFGAGNKAVSTTATGGATVSGTWLGRGVFIVLGLMLIAAGIFSFSKTQPIIQEFAKGVKEGASAALVA